jgi:class 3 adenylate cyclase
MPSTTEPPFGRSPPIGAAAFAVFGLLTAWVYTALRLREEVRRHIDARAGEFDGLAGVVGPLPRLAVIAFATGGILVLTWTGGILFAGWEPAPPAVMGIVAASALVFYVAVLAFVTWLLRLTRAHEHAELARVLLRSAAADGAAVGDDDVAFAERWSGIEARATLFLVVALPLVASPVLATHAFLGGAYETSAAWWLLAGVFAAGAAFHIWGTAVVLGIWNGHLATERAQLRKIERPRAAPPDAAGEPVRELIAIMLTDMVGYSKAMEVDERGAFRRLQVHNGIVRRQIQSHHGREIKTIGDAFLVTFRSANDAVNCALDVQRVFAGFNQDKMDDARIRIRIGVHLGDVLISGNDVFGNGVNVAARIEPLAEPGGVCISDAVYVLVCKGLEVTVERVPEDQVKLKNISIAPTLYRLRI